MSVISVTATVDTVNVPARVQLNVTDTGSPAFTSTTITRLNPDGTTSPVRTSDGNPAPLSGGTALLYDYEAPYGQSVTYSSLETPANVSAAVTVPASQVWLIHPGTPSLSRPINLLPGTLQDEVVGVNKAVYWVMNRSTPVTIGSGVRHAPSSQLVVSVETANDLAGLKSLLADGSVLMLNVPPSLSMEFDTCYIDVVTDLKYSRFTPNTIDPYRSVSLPFQVVGRPAGGTQSQRTLADLLVYPTLAALQAKYATLADVLAGP